MKHTKVGVADIWKAVIDGANTAETVAQTVGVSRGTAAMYLRVMHEIGLLHRTTEYRHVPRLRDGDMLASYYCFTPDHDAALRLGW